MVLPDAQSPYVVLVQRVAFRAKRCSRARRVHKGVAPAFCWRVFAPKRLVSEPGPLVRRYGDSTCLYVRRIIRIFESCDQRCSAVDVGIIIIPLEH